MVPCIMDNVFGVPRSLDQMFSYSVRECLSVGVVNLEGTFIERTFCAEGVILLVKLTRDALCFASKSLCANNCTDAGYDRVELIACTLQSLYIRDLGASRLLLAIFTADLAL